MTNRQYLKRNQTITLGEKTSGGLFPRTFTIQKVISGRGASVVCYEAYHENSGRGVLKEFYPEDAYGLERRADGQLICAPEFAADQQRFLQAEAEYLQPYEMLLDAKQNGSDQTLATFIPAFEIYHGMDSEGKRVGTTYIWTPEPELETFDKVCEEIHKHPNREPEHKLVTVLTAIESLTKCICALHSAGMIHRDIKPSNFGFVKRGGETLTQALSMFDINSICSVYAKTGIGMGTAGYQEPESEYESATNQTDLYSIGATLFTAIIVSPEAKEGGYCYRQEYYDRLREMVDESRLIRASEANSHPRLRNILTQILRRCLCERSSRYANCETLLDDLETALYYALPSEIARRRRSSEQWILADVEKSLDANQAKNSLETIQYHLYEHPLYRCSPDREPALQVLVVGFGNYGQKFLDACLQSGQIRGKKLQVTVVSDDETDRKIYLEERPELAEFFSVDNSLAGRDDTYGDIAFEISKLERGDQQANAAILQDLMCEHYDSKRPHYIFIALGEDSLNFTAAKACQSAVDVLEMNCLVSYVWEGEAAPPEVGGPLLPVYVNRDIKQSPLYPEIERMAFNTHLVWEKNLNVDYRTVRTDFRKAYNHDSCVSSVLALKYKLHSLGIDLETTDFDEAARRFGELFSDKGGRSAKNELIWMEHRRWVTEKLCQGWRRLRDLEACAGGVTKDEKRKRHVCIVPSRPDQKLAAEYNKNGTHEKWDAASESDLERLDELDRMSVRLHRMFVKKAEEARRQNLLAGNSMAGIRALIEDDHRAVAAFQEWFVCLKDIWSGEQEKVRLYKGLKQAFLRAAEGLPKQRRTSVQGQVKAFEAMFYPILASTEYRDWKQDDVALIENIPFILTYSWQAYLVIPFTTGDQTAVFDNVAAATVVGPARILYLYLVEKAEDLRKLRTALPYVMEYMKKKRFHAAVDLILLGGTKMASLVDVELKERLKSLGGGRIRQVKEIMAQDMAGLSQQLEAYLKTRSTGKRIFAVERNKTNLLYGLWGAGFERAFPWYEFDSETMCFTTSPGCGMLEYIRKKPYITATDMASFRRSSSHSSSQPEFFADYQDLWDKYSKQSGVWKQLCDLLGAYKEQNDVLVSFRKKLPREREEPREYQYIIPFVCRKSVGKILRFLKEQEILEGESRVERYTTDSCKVVIVDRCSFQREYNRLFSRVYALMLPEAITLHLNTRSHEAVVLFDDLEVTEVPLTGGRTTELSSLMGYFAQKGYVINLRITPQNTMSFTYATRSIKELLTTAGKMLEVYTYHKAKETGRFDDVVSGFEIDWEGTEVKSEFDCILTKGFCTLFVECKARASLDQAFYFKLAELAKQFGIHAKAVLVADTQERSFYDTAPVNALQRKRGSMMDVVTIWKSEEIANIGRTLLKVINGTYVMEEE